MQNPTSISHSIDNTKLISSDVSSVDLYSLMPTKRLIDTIKLENSRIVKVRFLSKDIFATIEFDGVISIFSCCSNSGNQKISKINSKKISEDTLTDVTGYYSDSRIKIYATSADGNLHKLEFSESEFLSHKQEKLHLFSAVSVASNPHNYVTGGVDGTIKVFGSTTGSSVFETQTESKTLRKVVISPISDFEILCFAILEKNDVKIFYRNDDEIESKELKFDEEVEDIVFGDVGFSLAVSFKDKVRVFVPNEDKTFKEIETEKI